DGLRRLEYRGYDSAGIAVAGTNGLQLVKCKGAVGQLVRLVPDGISGCSGIAHTRWATHGEPSQRNAHPHCDSARRIPGVHNGIVENAAAIRARLEENGVVFRSDTDTEVIAHLIAAIPGERLEVAVQSALRCVEGTYALVVLDRQRPDSIVVARRGSPVVL